ncbi:MAG: FimB/Mfa2 family fimbrial subunit [Odoribacter sp.]|nr:FimB/Mfa2 family fimbrial subunit [Odoribacter sp.]
MLVALSSCEKIYDDLEACPHGVSLRFVYDYNLFYANAFPKNVDCLTLYVYDEEGHYVATHVVTESALLQDEGWRMQLELPQGRYRFVAYGGLACEKSSFSLDQEPAEGTTREELRVLLDEDCLTTEESSRRNLHGFYWGELELETADLFKQGTVEMMKNTNNLRVVMRDLSNGSLDDEDYTFEVTDDNTYFAADNGLLPSPYGDVVYAPWAKGKIHYGITAGGEVSGAYAEFSLSRLMRPDVSLGRKSAEARLTVTSKKDGHAVIDVPLVDMLMLSRSEAWAEMEEQEFLDRQSEWELLFLIDNGRWVQVWIKVQDWWIRYNRADF